MRYLPYLIVAIALAGLLYVLMTQNNPKITNYPASGSTIVAFGDSLVSGVGATAGNDFVSVLARRIDEDIINLGNAGDTTAAAQLRLEAVLALDPKIVLVLLGGNDFLQRIPAPETFSNLENIITTIQDSGAIVVLLGVRGGMIRDEFNAEFERLASTYGAAYVPNVLAGLLTNPDLMTDAVHPSDAGYQLIADKIYPVLTPLLD